MRILAVCDVMENHLAAGATKAGEGVATFTDYQKLLDNRDINAVNLAVPKQDHRREHADERDDDT